jgi:3D (Asp-Asp-Asp) domain-containing protein
MAGTAFTGAVAAPRRPASAGGARAPGSGGRRWWPWLAGAPVLGLVGLVVLVLVLLAGGAQQQCGIGAALPGEFSGPGTLGGVAGTGLTRAQVETVRFGSPYAGPRVTGGEYVTTAYGPPWGGIQGDGVATSGGLALGGGAPRWYLIAVDPLLIGHGQLVYAWPNPFGWRGPFLAADTGAAIQGRRIDFYDWRGRATQLRWGHRTAQLSRRPIVPGGPEVATAELAIAACGIPLSSGVGERIGRLARAQLGRGPSIPGFRPPSVGYAWCAWFATNIWRKAGIPIAVSSWSGYPYDWAAANGLLFKQNGRAPQGPTPPVGSALMYGTSPAPPDGPAHINLVDRVLPDGSFMVTGGNQDGSRVTRYGPCRLRRADPAGLSGPGCDRRPIYGIAMPTRAENA